MADAGGHAAVYLAFDDHRVHDDAGVVARHVAQRGDLAGVAVYLHHRELHAEGERGRGRLEVALGLQAGAFGLAGVGRHLGPVERPGGSADHSERARVAVQHDVGRVGFEHLGGGLLGLFDHRLGCFEDRDAARLQRAGAAGAAAACHLVGVAVTHLDHVEVDAGHVGGYLGECRVMALPVVRRAGEHQRRPVVADLHGAELRGAHRVRDLHIRAPAQPEQLGRAVRTPPLLLGPQAGVVGSLHDGVEGLGVLAGIHVGAGRCLERERLGRDEVAAAQLAGVHPDLGCEQIHHPLDRQRGLGAPGAAVRAHRRGVRGDRVGGHRHVRNVVHA